MSKYTAQDVERIANAIRRSKSSAPFNLLIGAGCSLSAGIPLASALVEEINQTYKSECEVKLLEEDRADYGKCMSVLSPDERRELLRQYLDNAKVNWAHIAIASLMKEGFVESVLTFNFDSVLMRACGICALYPKIYDFATAPTENYNLIVSPAIVHLHGQGYGLAMMNSTEETEKHARSLKGFLQNVLNKNPLIVVGYSGESDAVFPVMTRVFEGQQRVYWLGHGDSPSRRVTDFLNKGGNSAEFLGGADADRILVGIARELDVFPPQFITNPYKHLLGEIEPVQELPFIYNRGNILKKQESEPVVFKGGVLNSSSDILKELRSELRERSEERQARQRNIPDIPSLMTQGKWDEIVKHANPEIPEQAELLALSYIMAGNVLLARAEVEQKEKLFQQSLSKYAEAAKIKPNYHVTFYNWGIALSGLAILKEDEDLFQQAFEKYAKAIKVKPDDHDAFNNWGLTLLELVKLKKDEDLFQQAFEKYAEAIKIKPDKHDAFNNWGSTLLELAKLKKDEGLFQQAFEKYAEAIKIKPDKHEAFNNWGSTLLELAKLKKDEDLFQQAFEKYAEAIKIKPDKYEAFYNWGGTLLELAKLKKDEGLFQQSFEKFADAVRIKPDMHEALSNWGLALWELAKLKKDEELLRQAFEKCAEAVKIKPNNYEALTNWGGALSELAKFRQDDTLFEEAERILLKAQEVNPDIVYNLACIKALRGQHQECRKLLEHCKSVGTLPSKDYLKEDSDLESVRDEEWFQELLD